MGSGDWTRDVIERLNNKRQEWESFCPRPMPLTNVDKQVVEGLLEQATTLISQPDSPLFSTWGLFAHLPGLRDKRFPMGVSAEGSWSELKRNRYVKFVLSTPTYWNDKNYYKTRWIESINMEGLENAAQNRAFKGSWVEKIFNKLQDETRVVERWERIVTQHGFHVLPTGFESFLPIGDDAGMFCEMKMSSLKQGMTEIQYVAQGKWSNAEYGHESEFSELVGRVVNSSPGPELMLGLPKGLRDMLAGV